MRLTISEAAKLSGVSVRTLHYYDEIGLLKVSDFSEKGYRYYDEESMEKLQQILFFRELQFPLSQIIQILEKSQNKSDILEKQRELLILKRNRLTNLIDLLDQTMRGEFHMSFKEFDMTNIEEMKQRYAKEVEERWGGSQAYKESCIKTGKYQKSDWADIQRESDKIMLGFAKLIGTSPTSNEAQELVIQWKTHVSKYYYECTDQILYGLGRMYIADERFVYNIDKNGAGTADFMSKAIIAYCNRNAAIEI